MSHRLKDRVVDPEVRRQIDRRCLAPMDEPDLALDAPLEHRSLELDLRAKHADALASVGANPNNGLGGVLEAIKKLPNAAEVLADFQACYDRADRPKIAMVDSDKGITNLHVPSDVIIDASMPAMIRDGGKMWNADGKLEDVKCIIPDRSYSGVFAACIDDCKKNGKFDVATMGSVANVGLMAKKAEEYGSHDKTFEIAADGIVQVLDSSGEVLIEHAVEAGDIWRATQTKHIAVIDWVRLAVSRARATGSPAVFWLDVNRSHDAQLIAKVHQALATLDVHGLQPQPEAGPLFDIVWIVVLELQDLLECWI